MSSGFTSGTTKGTSLAILHALELSITVAPYLTKIGANFKLASPPAENNAKSIFLSFIFSSEVSFTIYSLSLNFRYFPAERFEAKRYNSFIGKFLCSRISKNFLPTLPVAPTTATLYM